MEPLLLQQKLEQIAALIGELQLLVVGTPIQENLPLDMPVNEISRPSKIVEGIFNGQEMIGPDGQMYPILANYASKSKLVEGDALKLTISSQGTFVFKQIGPVPRDRLKGILYYDETIHGYRVLAAGTYYRILLASVTYYKGAPGDEVVILIPRGRKCSWAAVENILKSTIDDSHVYTLPKI